MELSLVPFVFLSTCQSNSGGGSSGFLFEYCVTFGYQRRALVVCGPASICLCSVL